MPSTYTSKIMDFFHEWLSHNVLNIDNFDILLDTVTTSYYQKTVVYFYNLNYSKHFLFEAKEDDRVKFSEFSFTVDNTGYCIVKSDTYGKLMASGANIDDLATKMKNPKEETKKDSKNYYKSDYDDYYYGGD